MEAIKLLFRVILATVLRWFGSDHIIILDYLPYGVEYENVIGGTESQLM